MCLFYMRFRQENALQSNMVIVPFSPKTVSSPRCPLTLPLRARATVMSTRFYFSCESYRKKLTYIRNTNSLVCLSGSVGCSSEWRPGGRWFHPHRGRQHSFVEIDHEIFSAVILSLPLIQDVSGERMCTILVNRLEDYACPVNVWLGKLTALDMTPLGGLGCKTST